MTETAFLNGDLPHEVYMKPAEEYSNSMNGKVYKLQKNLYGLKQGALEWNKKFNSALEQAGFTRSEPDPCLYIKRRGNDWTYLVIHVDDIIGAGTTGQNLDEFEAELKTHFKVKNLGKLKYYLGIQFDRDEDKFYLRQERYIKKKLMEFRLVDSRPSKVPMDPGYNKRNEVHEPMENKEIYRKAIGSLLYLSTNTRPDIAVATSILARKVSNPSEADWTEVKRVFRYLKHTIGQRLQLGGQHEESGLTVYADADWAGDAEDRKSNTGYLLRLNGSTIHWVSRKQQLVAISSTESEYVSLAEAAQDTLWIKRLIQSFGQEVTTPITVFEDNQSCIKLLSNSKAYQRTKHIDTKYHFVRDLVATQVIKVQYCASYDMIADVLTKPLEAVKLRKFANAIGLV